MYTMTVKCSKIMVYFFFAGSRINKQWFLVRDSQQGIDAVLTMVPWNTQCVISFTKSTKKTLKELFSLLQVCLLYMSLVFIDNQRVTLM